MKISRKSNVKGSQNVDSVTAATKQEATEFIMSAINALGTAAKTDIVAKESIANLSVVLLDLQS